MKNLFIILIAFVLVMSGCSKKSDPAPPPAPSLLGKWYVTKSTVTVYQNNVLVSKQDSPGDRSKSMTFNSDNTGSATDSGYESPFKYALNEKSLVVTFPPYNDPNNVNVATYTIKTMTLSSLDMTTEWGDVSYKETTDYQLAR